MSALTIAGAAVRMDDLGRFSLNDLHRAGGGASKHRPSLWLSNSQTKDLIAELDGEAGIPALATQRGGSSPGTYGRRELALAYAAWVASSFYLRVLRAADAVFSGQVKPSHQVQAALSDPTTLRALLLDQTDARLRLEAETERLHDEVARVAPKAEAYDRIAGHHGAMSLTAAGKVLGIRQQEFIAWLSRLNWIYRARDHGSWLGHATHIDHGHLRHRLCEIERSNGGIDTVPQVLVTAAGISRLEALLRQASHDQYPQLRAPTRSINRS